MRYFYPLLLTFFSFQFISQIPNYVPTNGLVGWWPFTGNANDLSGNGYNGIVNGATLTTDRFGNNNQAYNFGSSHQGITVNQNVFGVPTGNLSFTISFWHLRNAAVNSSQEVISNRLNLDPQYNFRVTLNSGGGVTYNFLSYNNPGNLSQLSSSLSFTQNWENIVVVGDLINNQMRMYRNGQLIGTNNSIQTASLTTPLSIGYVNNFDPPFQGKLDDIGIWNRALSQQEITALYTSTAGTVSALNCNGFTQTGNLFSGQAAANVSVSVPYTGGNAGFYAGQSIASTGVAGLTATRTSGTLANGNGTVSYTITGTPSGVGNATFAISVGGQSCNLVLPVTTLSGQYPANSVFCANGPTAIVDVTNPTTGKTWMDRNLGASQVATSSTDQNAYGDLYQWGRRSDGHQCRTSATTSTLSSVDQPAHGNFIIASSAPNDWRSPQNTNLWQGVNGVNNPCPSGYRIPTEQESDAERLSWSSNNSAGAFASQMKWPLSGGRDFNSGLLGQVGTEGAFWSNTVSGTSSRNLNFNSSIAGIYTNQRAGGRSVRCIKETVGSVGALNCNGNVQTGNLIVNQVASNVSVSVPYTGGNAGVYSAQTVSSTGVTGLTLSLNAGTLANGNGNISYAVTGTPSASGSANFAISLGGQNCTLTLTVYGVQPAYPAGTVNCNGNATMVNDVTNPTTGKTWMDRNLGASQVATSSTDQNAYGDLYQWGRRADGHQCRTSATTATLSSVDQPAHGNFILSGAGINDWRSPQNTNLWQGVNGVNNPCPSGYRLPTDLELNAELLSWSSFNATGAFNSVLKLTIGGRRSCGDGLIYFLGVDSYLWSSTINSTDSKHLGYGANGAGMGNGNRAHGISVRCIKETVGSVGSINCNGFTQSGNLYNGQAASNVSVSVPYTGGNGGYYAGQNISSTGVTGLTATLTSGTLSNGSGSLSYTLTGTPSGVGNATFALSVGGQSCNLVVPITALSGQYPANSVFCANGPTAIVDVTNPTTGKTWMDRNLGASQVATSSTDAASYGDLYQWGRRADGHQCRTSPTTATLSSVDQPAHGNFIIAPNAPNDWRSPQNTNLWQGVTGVNNPCPSGYRVPTEQELDAERLSWGSNNDIGAFGSPLKFPNTGVRNYQGFLIGVGSIGAFWVGTISGSISANLSFDASGANMIPDGRSGGYALRCIKETIASVGGINCNGNVQTGNLIVNQVASNVSVSVPYTAGNGGYYNAQTVTSTGVSGLTLSINAGYLANGNGNISYTVSGTPSASGSANFAISLGGQNCTLILTVYGVQPAYPAGTVNCNGNATIVNDVTNPTTGKTWMDRNLGASQVATSSTDQNAYGDLYQWGRRADGHQCRTSATTSTLSSVDQPAHGNFILGPNAPFDWRSPQNANLWQGVNGVNNPCPSGYRIPTSLELDNEKNSWSVGNLVGALNSTLKIPAGGYRDVSNGSIYVAGSQAYYWSSTINSNYSIDLNVQTSNALMYALEYRGQGFSVRCIKETIASVGALNCNGNVQTGNLIINQAAANVSVSVPYTAGNGGYYNTQTVTSTGVSGLTLSVNAGYLANGNGNISYTVSGTPSASGSANFAISLGGQNCTLTLNVFGVQPSYPAGTVNCNGNATMVNDVTNPTTGKTWMDRNLGASQVATSSTDQNAYGDLYQWGRRADGHQCRTSPITATLSSVDQPAHGNFIVAPNAPNDWRSPQNNNLWQGVNGVNNPCPSGYRVPTEQELDAERLSWSSNNSAGAFSSTLKLSVAGCRDGFTAALNAIGTYAHYYASTININDSRFLNFSNSAAIIANMNRAYGYSIRCIKETVGSVGALNCNGTTLSGGVYANQAILGTTANVPYTGGNGGYFTAQTLNSTGVTGITATLSQGLLANGAGTLAFALSGTPSGTGSATFALTIGGQSCSFTVNVQSFASIAINTNDTICNGTSTTLTASVVNAGTSCAAPGLSGTLTNGLVGYWPFCGNANDLSGNANHGTVNGATLTTDRFGVANSAYSFDGVNDYIEVQDNASLNNPNISVGLWLNTNSAIFQQLLYKVSLNTAQNEEYSMPINLGAPNKINLDLKNNSCTPGIGWMTFSSNAILNNWVHASFTHDGSTTKFYLNGALVNSQVANFNIANCPGGKLIMGIAWDLQNGLNGKLDDIGIWNRALTQQEITQLYQQGQVSYLWSNGATTPSITVSPTQTTTYTCTVTMNGATTTQTQTITVNALPTVNAGQDQTVFAGTQVTLSGSGANSYAWNNGVTNNTPFAATTTTTYTVTGISNGCSSTDQVLVTVLPAPNLTINTNDTICNGTSTTLTASVANAGTSCVAPGLSGTLTNGLVGYWPFCGNANDLSGNANHGTVNGATLTTDRFGSANSAYGFNSGNITINNLNLNLSSNYSVSFWAHPLINLDGYTVAFELTQGTFCNNNPIVGFWNNDLIYSTCGNIYSNVNMGSFVNLQNQWSHYTVTLNNGITTVSKNGSTFNSGAINWPNIVATILTIGNNGNYTPNNMPFKGKLDDFGIWNRALTQQEITQLYQQGQATYSWSPGGATTPSITVSPTQTTTYTCTITMNGATTTQTQTITVNALPTVTATANQTVCAGTSVTLSGSGASSYSWNNGISNGVAFTPNSTTTYTVTGTNANGCTNTAQTTVTVNALPTVTATANQTVCAGTSVTLSGSGASSYVWNNNVQNGVAFVPNATTTYTVTGTNANGCINTAQTTVTVNPLPVATITAQGATTFCQNNSVTLNANSGAGLSYQWYNNGSAINGANNATLPVSNSGSYTVQVTNANNCSQTSAATAVSVNALPAATITPATATTFCQGGSVVLNANVGQGLSYQWNLNGSPINGANAASYTANASGNYSLDVLNSDGCSATATAASVTVNALPTVSAGANQTLCAGTAITLSGTGATSYTWNNNVSNGVAFTPASTQTYTVTGTNANGCANTAQVTVTVNALPTPSISYVGSPILCQGSVLALNSSAGSSYLWSNGQTTQTIQVTQGGAYTVQVTNANGCVGTSNAVTLTVNPLPAPSLTAQGPTTFCQGGNVVLTSTGATSYSWSTNATTQSITVTTSGLYQVSVVDNKGCSGSSAPIQVTVLSPPNASITTIGSTALCAGQSTSLSAPAGNTYLWSNGASTQNITVNTAGTYSVQVTNAAGCSANSNVVTISVNPVPVANISANGATSFCSGGSVVLTASAGASYLWNTGATTQSITVNSSGTFNVTVTGAGGCNATSAATSVTVNALPTASITASGNTTFCAGNSVLLSASNGNSYLWSNGATTPSISATAAGSYSVSVTNGAGCSATSTPIQITVNPLPSVSAGANQSVCIGGQVTLSGSGANTYTWNNGVTNGIAFTPANTQTYTVTGTNANGCSNTAQVTVTVNALPAVSAGANQSICSGSQVTLMGSGANTYAWNNGVTNGVAFTPANTQTYTVTGTNANGCSNTAQVTVTVNALPSASISASGSTTLCAGSSVNLSASNGSSYLWSNGATTQTITASSAGNYSVQVTNAAGCNATSTIVNVVVNPLPAANITANGSTTFCAGGSVILSATAGASYLWNTGATTQTLTVNTSGTYTVTVTSNNGCVGTSSPQTVTVSAQPSTSITANGATSFCAGGSVLLSAPNGGTYLWSTGATTPSISVSTAGNYSVTVTNGAGCSATSTPTTITVNPLPSVSAGANQSICAGNQVTLNGSGASSYTWNNGVTNGLAFTPATTQTYTVTGTNANGCTNTAQVTVTVNALPVVSAGANQSICSGAQVTLNGSGATSYAWNNGVTNGVAFTPANTQTYTVTGTNANGCANTAQVTVTVNALPAVSAGANQSICAGAQVTLNGLGATSYAWNNGVTNGVAFTPVNTQTYTVTGTNANGCTNTAQVTVSVNALPTVSAGANQSICSGAQVTLNGSGASSYIWNNGVTNGVIFTPATTQTYTVTGTNANGCSNTAQVTVTVNALPVVSAGANQSICSGAQVTLNGSGATSYAWNNGVTNGVAFTPANTQTYTVTGTNANGCANTAQVTVSVNALPAVSAGANQSICSGAQVTLNGSGASSYAWSNGVTNSVAFTPVNTQTYTVTGTNANGCTNTAQVTVTVNALPTVSAGANQSICTGAQATLNGSGATSYAWNNGVTNGVAFTPANTQTYTVTGTNANGCTNTAQVTVTVNALPVVSAGANQSICTGAQVTLNGSGATSYAWNNGVTNGVAFTPANTQTYTVTGTNANGCSNTAQVTVTVNALPTANAGSNALINCVNNPNGATLGAAPQAGFTYQWSPATGLSSATLANPVANPINSTGYTLTVTQTATGCSNTASVNVTVNSSAPQANAGQNSSITCVANTNGVNIGSNPSAGLTYAWTPSTGLSASNISNPVANPLLTTTYTLTITNTSNGCTGSGTVTVSVNNTAPTVNAGQDQTVCAGQSVTLNATGANTYVWNNGAIQGVAFTPSTTQTYTVQGTNTVNGCTATDQVTVTLNALPTVSAGTNQTVCAGTAVSLTGTGASSYAWNNGVSNGVAFSPANTQTYTVTGTDANGCSNTAQVTVTVNALPVVSAGANQSICAGTAVTLSGSGATNYTWNNGVSNGVAFTPMNTQTYTVIGTNANGCQGTAQVTVTVNPVPTPSISANGTSPYCPGTNVVMSTPSLPGHSYQWYFGQNIINGAVSASYTATTAGTYYVKVTAPGGCFGNSNSITISYLNPTIIALGPTNICQGGSVALQTVAGAGYQYSWMKNGMTMINPNMGNVYTATSGGTYTVKIVTPSGCVMYSNSITVTLIQNPSAAITAQGSTSFCNGSSVTLTASNNANAVVYQWRKNGVNITGATSQSYTATQAGTYTVVIANQACPATSAVVSNGIYVNVFPTPNPWIYSSSTTVSTGSPSTLYTITGIGLSYQWYKVFFGNSMIAIPGATQATYVTNSSGIFRVKVTNMYGCWKYSNTISIASSQMPEPGVSCLSDGIHVKHGAEVSQEGTWYEETTVDRMRIAAEWNEGAQEWVLSGKTEGNFVYITIEEELEMQWMRVADVCTERTLVAYPNPTWNVVYLKGLEAAEKHYELQDVMGRTVAVGNLSSAQNAIDMSNLAPGTYRLVLQGYGVIAIVKE